MSARQIASFFDLRYKDLKHEAADAKEKIRTRIKSLLYNISENKRDMQIQTFETSGAQKIFYKGVENIYFEVPTHTHQ
jgi:hypothetical protein